MKDIDQQNTFSRPLTRRHFLSTGLKAGAAAFTTALLPKLQVDAESQYNVIFIIVDDLRPLLGCYGHPEMHTPNIDRLAQRGTLFSRAYSQYPLCSPSRTSMLTGLRPETTGVLNNRAYFRETASNIVTLPQHFKAHGYYTQSVGRVFHTPDFQDDENSWSASSWRPTWYPTDYETTPSWNALDVEDDDLKDGKVAKRAVEVLEQIKNQQFFLAVGFYKPHLPYNAPKKYFELYENTTFTLPVLSGESSSDVVPPPWNEIRPYNDISPDDSSFSHQKIIELTRAYAAATSYIDVQIGRVLDQLDELGLTKKTVVAFCGDHGYHLSEYGTWGKNIIYETTLRSPLIVSVPGQCQQGAKTNALVELVDIFPTLCEVSQIPILPQLEGLSMAPVIEQPTVPWKTAVFSQHKQAHSMRTDRYRYTESGSRNELYDYGTNPNSEQNIANQTKYSELVAHLSERLRAGWQEALPDVIPSRVACTQTLKWDVNDDGIVDIEDLLLVANSFETNTPEYLKVDVNKDGRVDLIDFLLVASHLGESSDAASPISVSLPLQHVDRIEQLLIEARLADNGSNSIRQGIANLEMLIDAAMPTKTVLLPNYPNPFNPETWIPYDLAEAANVCITIYNQKGKSVKQLNIGFQTEGTYRTQSRAAYWDGCNSAGESVASGVYFYTLCAGQTKTTRRMVIAK